MLAEELLISLSALLFRLGTDFVLSPLREHLLRLGNMFFLRGYVFTPGLCGSFRTRSFFLKLSGISLCVKALLLHGILL